MRIWAFSVRRWQFTLVLFGLLIAVGVNAYLNVPRSEDPEFHAPIPTVVVVYPGADPEDIESLVVDPIEDAINELDDIKRMESRSMDGVGVIQIEFHWHTDPDEKYDEVVREVNRIRGELPADLASLEIRKAGSGTRQHRADGARQRERELARARGARRGPEATPSRRRRACAAARPGPSRSPRCASRSTSSGWVVPA